MSSMGQVDGYSTLSMSPKQSFATVRRVCWDQNVTDSGARQWTEVVIVPASRVADGSLNHVNPDFADVDETSKRHDAQTWGIMVNGSNRYDYAGLRVFGNGSRQVVDFFGYGRDQAAYESRATRRQHCITDNGNNTVTVRIDQGIDGFYQRIFTGHFPANARVILEQHSYTPAKDGEDCRSVGVLTGCRTSWHWDNITVE